MAHVVRIDANEQFKRAISVLNELPGMWHSRGDDITVELWLLDSHYEALVKAGIIPANGKNGKEAKAHGKKAAKKSKSR